MDIYLRIELRSADGADPGPADSNRTSHLGDVLLQVEPSHTVADVRLAIVDYFALDGSLPWPVSRPETGALGSAMTVVEARLLTGETLILGGAERHRPHDGGGVSLVITSGPDSGACYPLIPGTTIVIGRDPGCDVPMTDPQISRRHLKLIVDSAGAVYCEPTISARNVARTNGAPVRERCLLPAGQVVRLGASSVAVRRLGRPPSAGPDAFGNIAFHRTPYFPAPVREIVVGAIQEIPSTPEKTRFAYLSAVMPLVIGGAFALMFGPRYLLFALFSPVMLAANHLEQRRRTGRRFVSSVERFNAELDDKTVEVSQALSVERRHRFDAAPDVSVLADRANHRSAELWVRSRDAADFLTLRVGLGDVPAAVQFQPGSGGDVEFRDRIGEAIGSYEAMTDVPITIDLSKLGVVGLVGAPADTTALAASLLTQACCLHGPEDMVVLCAAIADRAITDFMKWAPHTRSASSPIAGPHLVATKRGADALLAELVDEVANRGGARRGSGSPSAAVARPWLFVVLDRLVEPDPALVSRLLDACPAAGISVVWLTDTEQRVPRQSQAVVHCRPPMSGRSSVLSFTNADRQDQPLDIDGIGGSFAATIGRALAPLRDASLANGATAIPRMVPLFGALGAEAVDADWILDQWKIARGYSLPAPIGFGDGGPLELDIVDDGPHGLIGGTSGAGKSELVMSMVAGLIARNPPTRVNFLFVDYKGGASSDLFSQAPHTVGYVTNLDGLLAMRALTSLRAELNRRMNLLQGRAKDLAEMIERFPDEAPPSLVIVVDEFATLVKEIPEFVAGIVDIAQRGRSLGIHLLLATQRPSGSVNDNIKANTNMRISLRMLDGAESAAVIGTADAAAIPGPLKGRGFVRIGSSEPVPFQSAWAGAPLLADSGRPPVAVRPFDAAAVGLQYPDSPPNPEGHKPRTQVDALLSAVAAATERLGLDKGRAPWLEMLPAIVSIEQLRDRIGADGEGEVSRDGERDGEDRRPLSGIPFGLVDDPAAQAQYPAVLNLAKSGGLIVSGTGGSGKSTLLQTIAISAAMDDSDRSGGHLTVFAIDFTSRELGALARLPQCGAVATGDDLEAVTRIIGLLYAEFGRRRKVLADAVGRAEPPPVLPMVLLLIDGMDALTQTMEHGPGGRDLAQYYADLTTIVSEGRQVEIFPIISTTRRSAIRAGIASAISARLTLRQSDPQGYIDCGIGSADAKELDLLPGQGFIDGSNLVQVAMLTEQIPKGGPLRECSDGQAGRGRFVEVAEGLTGRIDQHLKTAPLPLHLDLISSPDSVSSADSVPSADGDPVRPIIGRADVTSAPFILDLGHDDVSIIGDPRSGRSTALATIARQVTAAGGEVLALGRPGSPLGQVIDPSRSCFDDGVARQRFLEELLERVTANPTCSRSTQVLLLDDYDLLPEHDRALIAVTEQLLGVIRYVAAGPKPRGFSSNPLVQLIKGCRSMVYLRPLDAREAHETLGIPVPWHPGLAMVEGRGIVVVDRVATIVQFSDPFFADGE